MNKIIDTLIKVSALSFFIALCAYAYRGFYLRLLADDYCFGAYVIEKGLWGAQIHWFTDFNGRYTFNLLSSVFHEYVHITPFLTLFVWAFILFWSLKQLSYLMKPKIKTLCTILLTEVILFVHLNSSLNVEQSFFWQTGRAAYTTPLLFFTFYIGLLSYYIKQILDKKNLHFSSYIWLFLTIFLASGFSETYTIIQFIIFGITIGAIYFAKKRHDNNALHKILLLLISSFLGGLAGFIIMYIAPGNLVRQSRHSQPPNIVIPGILSFAFSLYYLGTIFLYIYKYLIIVFFTGFIVIITDASNTIINKSRTTISYLTVLLPKILFSIYVIIFASGAIPLYAIYGYPGARALAIPNFFIVITFVYIGIVIGLHWHKYSPHISHKKEFLICATLFFLILGPIKATITIIMNSNNYILYAHEWDEQEEKLYQYKNQQKQNIIVKALGYTYNLEDVQKNSSHWVNDCMARYYGLKTVKAQ